MDKWEVLVLMVTMWGGGFLMGWGLNAFVKLLESIWRP
jgi:hypothetical protein